MNDSILFVEMELGGENWQCGVWLSTYGVEPARTDSLQTGLTDRVNAVFPAAGTS